MGLNQPKGCALLHDMTNPDSTTITSSGRAWADAIKSETLQDEAYQDLKPGATYVVLGIPYNLQKKWQPMWERVVTKLEPKVIAVAHSVLTQ